MFPGMLTSPARQVLGLLELSSQLPSREGEVSLVGCLSETPTKPKESLVGSASLVWTFTDGIYHTQHPRLAPSNQSAVGSI